MKEERGSLGDVIHDDNLYELFCEFAKASMLMALQIKKLNESPMTYDTKELICLWNKEGDTPNMIAKILCRPLKDINNILEKAKESGEYEEISKKHINGFHGCKLKERGKNVD